MSEDCHIFTGCLNSNGYGVRYVNGKQIGAHRLSYILSVGYIPKGMMVLHSCDVKACVNPTHLRIGTAKENAADAVARGQIPVGQSRPCVSGEKHAAARLTNSAAKSIREARKNGALLRELAESFGVDISIVHRICSGKSYKEDL